MPLPDRLFVYGTLRDEALVERLTGRRFVSTPAVLEGYGRECLAGGYPRIFPASGGSVHGQLLHGIDTVSLQALDEYEDEGRLYRRTTVRVVSGGATYEAMTYVGLDLSR
ncbi:gamma-glutamylcyclotransferase [Candidatus Binatia bacterium]|nr:gamma-glutamylcyclotransferase [Candidatus Binatia bacterium]